MIILRKVNKSALVKQTLEIMKRFLTAPCRIRYMKERRCSASFFLSAIGTGGASGGPKLPEAAADLTSQIIPGPGQNRAVAGAGLSAGTGFQDQAPAGPVARGDEFLGRLLQNEPAEHLPDPFCSLD